MTSPRVTSAATSSGSASIGNQGNSSAPPAESGAAAKVTMGMSARLSSGANGWKCPTKAPMAGAKATETTICASTRAPARAVQRRPRPEPPCGRALRLAAPTRGAKNATSAPTARKDNQNPVSSGAIGSMASTKASAVTSPVDGASRRPTLTASAAIAAMVAARVTGSVQPANVAYASAVPMANPAAIPRARKRRVSGVARVSRLPNAMPSAANMPMCNPEMTKRCTVAVSRNRAHVAGGNRAPSPVARARTMPPWASSNDAMRSRRRRRKSSTGWRVSKVSWPATT